MCRTPNMSSPVPPPPIANCTLGIDKSLDDTMANLSLCSCSSRRCECRRNSKEKDYGDKNYPDFWRRTLSNKILERKSKFNKNKSMYEFLRPSKLQFISATQIPREPGTIVNDISKNGEEIKGRFGFRVQTSRSLPDLSRLNLKSQADLPLAKLRNPADVDIASLGLIRLKPRTWKNNRQKLNLKGKRTLLPTIPEDIIEGGVLESLSLGPTISGSQSVNNIPHQSCSQQALSESSGDDITIDELASYLDLLVHIPKKMSPMAEMMYT